MREDLTPSNPPPKTPGQNRASNLLFIVILVGWLLFILIFGGKGPG